MKHVLVVGHPGRLVPDGQTVLARDGVALLSSRTGAEALELLARHRPEAMVVGGDPPDTTVVELCRTIREQKGVRQPAILLIASPLEKTRIEAITKAGATGVLPRPLAPSAFDEALGRLLTIPSRRAFRVLVRVKTSSGGVAFGESRNLSLTGMLLESNREFTLGDRLDLSFFLPGDRTEIAVHAEVVRSKSGPRDGFETGLRFAELAGDAERAIRRFVESRQAKYPAP